MPQQMFSKGCRSRWGVCDAELRSKVTDAMYEMVIRHSGGLDKSEVLRNWIGEIGWGRLEVVTGRHHIVANTDDRTDAQFSLPKETRDHLAALATLEGMTVSQYVEHIVSQHLYGLEHDYTVASASDADKRGRRAG